MAMNTPPLQGGSGRGVLAGLWHALTGLDFITTFFTWLFLLFSRLAEPLMTLSAIYVIICAGIPTWEQPTIYNTALAVMIAAPEIILPGAFILAAQKSEQGEPRAWLLHVVCWLFVLLTAVTLADLFIFHFQGPALAAIMWGRCVVGIGYSILLRVLSDGQEPEQPSIPQPVQVQPSAEIDALTKQIADLSSALSTMQQTIDSLKDGHGQQKVDIPSIQITEEPVQAGRLSIDAPVVQTGQNGPDVQDRQGAHAEKRAEKSSTRKPQGPVEHQPTTPAVHVQALAYPAVPGISAEKVKAVIDTHLSGVAWSKIPGNYSRDIKPIRDAWQSWYQSVQGDESGHGHEEPMDRDTDPGMDVDRDHDIDTAEQT